VSRPLAVHRSAIVVGLQDHREADRIVRLLVPESGRITALARSARSSTKRFGGALDLGNKLEVTMRPPKNSNGWWGLDSAALEDGRPHVRSSLERLALLAYCTEVCGQLAREDHPEPKLFGLLDMALSLLDAIVEPPSTLFRLGLETKALTFAGVGPELTRCVNCGSPIEDPATLLPHGASHLGCGSPGRTAHVAWLNAVENARRTPLRDTIDHPISDGPAWAFSEAIEAHIGRGLRSRSVLATLSV